MSAKGGTSKTTLAINIAAELNRVEQDCCLVDTDPQGSLASFISHNHFVDCYQLEGNFKSIEQIQHDVVIVDSAPVIQQGVTEELIKIADFILIPCRISKFDIESNKNLIKLCEAYNKPYAIVWTQTDQYLFKYIDKSVKALTTRFHKSIDVVKATEQNKTLVEINSKLMANVQLILQEIVEEYQHV